MTQQNLLIRALRANALFSMFSAIAMSLAANWLAEQLGPASTTVIYVVAAGLLLFALQLGYIGYSRKVRRWEIKAIVAGDLAWVAGSVIYVALFHRSLTIPGLLLIDGVAVVVLYFAVQQIRGLRQVPGSPGRGHA